MLPQALRLRNRTDFDAVYAQGTNAHTRFLKIVAFATTYPATRYGVVVSNSVLKKAVDRNKKKRQIRSILAKISATLKPHDVVIVLKYAGAQATFVELERDIAYALRKVGVI